MGYLIILLVVAGLIYWAFGAQNKKPPSVDGELPGKGADEPFVIEHQNQEPEPVAVETALEVEDPVVAQDPLPILETVVEATAQPVPASDQISVEPVDPLEFESAPQVIPVQPVVPAELNEEPAAEPVPEPVVEPTVDVPQVEPTVETLEPEPVTIKPEPVVEPPKPFESALIYLVDDSVVVRTKLMRLVAGAGYRAQGAGDGIQGLKLFEVQRPDLIITDIEMPEMDGYQLINHLNQNEKTRDIPVIAISGHEGIRSKLTHFPNVVDAFHKPWDAPALLARLEELVGPGKEPRT